MVAEGGFASGPVVHLVINDPLMARVDIDKVLTAIGLIRETYGVDISIDSLDPAPPGVPGSMPESLDCLDYDKNYLIVNGRIVSLDGPVQRIYKVIKDEMANLLFPSQATDYQDAGVPWSLGGGPPGGVDADYVGAA